jgi:hypothetical protein
VIIFATVSQNKHREKSTQSVCLFSVVHVIVDSIYEQVLVSDRFIFQIGGLKIDRRARVADRRAQNVCSFSFTHAYLPESAKKKSFDYNYLHFIFAGWSEVSFLIIQVEIAVLSRLVLL